jgi:hypothetical protein
MGIDPKNVALFIPPGLKKFKLKLFEDIGQKIIAAGGRTVRHDYAAVAKLPDEMIPIVGVSPQFRSLLLEEWPARNRPFIFWDRGYLRRVFATWLPTGAQLGVPGGYYRWTLNAFQMKEIKDVPADRWRNLRLDDQVRPWNRNGRHILVAAAGGTDYDDVFSDRGWTIRTVAHLGTLTDRPIIVRDKESKVPLWDQLRGAHALVTHGSIAAIEAVVMGCPVFVHPFSAARLVGQTDVTLIDNPVYPDRERWLWSLAYSQWSEVELCDGTLWRQIW